MREITITRPFGSIRPGQGWDCGNAVAMLFEQTFREGLDPARIDVTSIRLRLTADSVVASAMIDYPEDQRYACGCTGEPHWGPAGCRA